MKGLFPCPHCKFGVYIEGHEEGETVHCPNCGKEYEGITQDDLL